MKETTKSYEEHLDFLHKSTRLMLWFAWNWAKCHPEEGIISIVQEKIIVFDKLGLKEKQKNSSIRDFKHSYWISLVEKIKEIYKECKGDKDATRFENLTFEVFKPGIDLYSQKDYEEDIKPHTLNAGSLGYDSPKIKEHPNWCNFHIANAVAPESIFADRKYLPKCFLTLMEKSEEKYGYDTLHTFTWLNSRPRWLELFPREWLDNMEAPDSQVGANLGYWGQIITSRGTFNEKIGEYIRKFGELKYKPCHSHCSFKSMRKHLERYL